MVSPIPVGVCVCAGFLCVYTPAIENHQRQLATHTYLGSSLVKTKGENGSLASGTNSVHLRVGLRACCGASNHQHTSGLAKLEQVSVSSQRKEIMRRSLGDLQFLSRLQIWIRDE